MLRIMMLPFGQLWYHFVMIKMKCSVAALQQSIFALGHPHLFCDALS
jgi:hypothetical protein